MAGSTLGVTLQYTGPQFIGPEIGGSGDGAGEMKDRFRREATRR